MPTILISIHIGTGVLGLLAGAGVLIARKGARCHRTTNAVFASMLIMSGLGAYGSLSGREEEECP